MRPLVRALLAALPLGAIGCTTTTVSRMPSLHISEPEPAATEFNLGTTKAGFVPINPIVLPTDDPPPTNSAMLDGFPNEVVRISVGEVKAGGTISFAMCGATAKGHDYVVTLDYVKYRTHQVSGREDGLKSPVGCMVGVGLRVVASFRDLEGDLHIGGLYSLGVAAEQKRIRGTLIVQSLGITGKGVSPLMPMPSAISVNAIEGAIQTVAAIKAKMYYQDDVRITPQVISVEADGVDLPVAVAAVKRAVEGGDQGLCGLSRRPVTRVPPYRTGGALVP